MLYIVHIGKCGGGTIDKELKKKKILNKKCHGSKPILKKKFKYVILIRDPITRFISAFNWKKFRCLDKEGRNFQGMKEQKNPLEIKGYKYWKTINNLAENLYDENEVINKKALELINNSNHLHNDINFYLEDLLPYINKNNCKVIRFEHYNDDIKNILGINSVTSKRHMYKYKYSKYLSKKGVDNLKKFLEKDYNCFKILKKNNIISPEYYRDIESGIFVNN